MDKVIQITCSTLLALIPAVIWGYLMYKRNPQARNTTILVFVAGGLAVFPILLYRLLWTSFPWINAFRIAENFQEYNLNITSTLVIPVSVLITFMIVGIIEEVMKMIAVKTVDENKIIDSIDDAIELFIIAALGFSFIENILYFYSIWIQNGPTGLFVPFLFRSAFSTFAHILFSGILGYFYGVAYFAKPILQEEIRKNRKHWTVWLHKIFAIRKEKLFHEEKLFEGLLIAIALHALFNIILEIGLLWLIVPFLFLGYSILNHLLDAKENHKVYGHVTARNFKPARIKAKG